MTQSQNPSLPQARVIVKHPYLSMMCLYFGGFTGMYSETALNIALPQLSLAFGVELNIVQWLVVAYMLVIGLVLPFASLLMKWFTARQITLFALCSFLIGALISGFAGSFEICLVGRCIQGIGTGLVLPLMFAMVLEVIPPHKIGQAMGVAALVIMFAPAIGPTLAGFLIGTLSWRWIFFSFCITLAIAILFAIKFEVNPYELTKPRIDAISVITSCFGFGGIVLGAGMVSLFGFTSAPVLGSFAVGIVCLAAGQNTYFAAGGTDSALAFTEGSHIGFAFTLIMAVFGFFLAFRINLQKEQSAQKEESVADASVLSSLMQTEVFSVNENANALEALRLFTEKEISGAPVLDNNDNLCGFVSDGDIIGTLAHQDTTFTSFYSYTIDSNEQGFEEKASALIGMKVGTIATKNVLTVDLQDDMRTVCATLAQHHLKKAPVMDKGKMIGIVSRTDITRYTVGLYAKAN